MNEQWTSVEKEMPHNLACRYIVSAIDNFGLRREFVAYISIHEDGFRALDIKDQPLCEHVTHWMQMPYYDTTTLRRESDRPKSEKMQDLIERRAALTALCEDCLRKYDGICPHPASRCVEFRTIKQLPAIEAEPVRHGRWNYRHEDDWCYCTACGTDAEGSDGECLETDYCPHCGAKMDGKFTLGSEANGCWISCAECANTGCKNRYVQEVQEDDKR